MTAITERKVAFDTKLRCFIEFQVLATFIFRDASAMKTSGNAEASAGLFSVHTQSSATSEINFHMA